MTAIVSKSVVLTIATLLALPPGWCCRVSVDEMVEAAPAKSECCQHSSQQQPGERLPTAPDVECCCSHDEAIPAKVIELPDTPTIAWPAVFDLGDVAPGSEYGCDSAMPLFDPGPKLHILKCVWRC